VQSRALPSVFPTKILYTFLSAPNLSSYTYVEAQELFAGDNESGRADSHEAGAQFLHALLSTSHTATFT
jgi:hypothetical protein